MLGRLDYQPPFIGIETKEDDMNQDMYNETLKNFDNIGKVYLVWSDNGEPYEDGFSYIEKIFTTKEAAEKYLDDRHTRKDIGRKTNWVNPKFVCSMGNIDCHDCPKQEQDIDEDGFGYCHEEWIRNGNECDNEFWYIEEMNLWGLKGERDCHD